MRQADSARWRVRTRWAKQSVIPSDELIRFAACARDAWDLGADGRSQEGYTVLDLGLTWAETPALHPTTGEPSLPEPWMVELVALYQSELARYLVKYGPMLGKGCLHRRVQITRADAREVGAASRFVRERSEQLRQRAQELTQRATELRRAPGPPEHDAIR